MFQSLQVSAMYRVPVVNYAWMFLAFSWDGACSLIISKFAGWWRLCLPALAIVCIFDIWCATLWPVHKN